MSELSANNGRMQEAQRQSEDALLIFYALDDCLNIGHSTYWLGNIAHQCSAYPTARAYYAKAAQYLERAGDEVSMTRPLISLGDVSYIRCDYAAAQEAQEKALAILTKFNRLDVDLGGWALLNLALAQAALDNHDAAIASLQQSIQIFDRFKSVHGKLTCDIASGDFAYDKSAFEEAETYYRKALVSTRKVPLKEDEAICQYKLGKLAHKRGRLSEAVMFCMTSFAMSRSMGGSLGQATCMQKLGDIFLDEGDPETAETTYNSAIPLLQQLGTRLELADCYLGIGRAALKSGNSEKAAGHLKTARSLYLEIGNIRGGAECDQSILSLSFA